MTKIRRGKDGRAAFTWVVELTVSRTWVEDGFNLDKERALSMLAHDLGYAYEDLELGAKILDAPDPKAIAKAQGA